MNHLDKIDLIERYHRGQLNATERQNIEQRMSEEPDFAAEVDEYCGIFVGFDMLHLECFDAQLQCFEAKAKAEDAMPEPSIIVAEPPKVQLQAARGGAWFNLRNMAAAIAFLVFVPVSYYMFMGQSSPFDEHFSPSSALLVDARRDSSSLSPQLKACQEAFSAYNTPKNYAKALPLLKNYAASYGMTPQIQLYIGVSNLYLNQLPEAVANLEIVAQTTNNRTADYQQEAEFMLALAYLRQNNTAKTKEILAKINTQTYHNYKKQAADLSADLSK